MVDGGHFLHIGLHAVDVLPLVTPRRDGSSDDDEVDEDDEDDDDLKGANVVKIQFDVVMQVNCVCRRT